MNDEREPIVPDDDSVLDYAVDLFGLDVEAARKSPHFEAYRKALAEVDRRQAAQAEKTG